MAKNARYEGDIITPPMIASYPHLVEPRANNRGEKRYEICLVAQDPKSIKGLVEIAKSVLIEQFGPKALELVQSGKLHMPFRKVDSEDVANRGWPEGGAYFNVGKAAEGRNGGPVGVVSRVKNTDGKPTVLDPAAIYAGCLVRASLDCYAYQHAERKGVTFALRNIMFWEDGERLDGVRPSDAQDEFADMADIEGDADLADLEAGGEEIDEGLLGDLPSDAPDPIADLLF